MASGCWRGAHCGLRSATAPDGLQAAAQRTEPWSSSSADVRDTPARPPPQQATACADQLVNGLPIWRRSRPTAPALYRGRGKAAGESLSSISRRSAPVRLVVGLWPQQNDGETAVLPALTAAILAVDRLRPQGQVHRPLRARPGRRCPAVRSSPGEVPAWSMSATSPNTCGGGARPPRRTLELQVRSSSSWSWQWIAGDQAGALRPLFPIPCRAFWRAASGGRRADHQRSWLMLRRQCRPRRTPACAALWASATTARDLSAPAAGSSSISPPWLRFPQHDQLSLNCRARRRARRSWTSSTSALRRSRQDKRERPAPARAPAMSSPAQISP